MQIPTSTVPPRPLKANQLPPELTETWRQSRIPPRLEPTFPQVEQRSAPRTRVHGQVEFTTGDGAHSTGDGTRHAGLCRNLSLGGAAIQTTEPAPFGCRVVVFMQLDGIDAETALGGTVRWSKPGVMGVQWDSQGARVTHALLRTAAQLKKG
jgi:hypothetical protein